MARVRPVKFCWRLQPAGDLHLVHQAGPLRHVHPGSRRRSGKLVRADPALESEGLGRTIIIELEHYRDVITRKKKETVLKDDIAELQKKLHYGSANDTLAWRSVAILK